MSEKIAKHHSYVCSLTHSKDFVPLQRENFNTNVYVQLNLN